jgi:hypothetical protein
MADNDQMVTVGNNLNKNISQLIQTIQSVFPQVTSTASTATGGAATLPANPVGFFSVTTPSGTVVKVPYYNT